MVKKFFLIVLFVTSFIWIGLKIYHNLSSRTQSSPAPTEEPVVSEQESDAMPGLDGFGSLADRYYKSKYGYLLQYPKNSFIIERSQINDEVLETVVVFIEEEGKNKQICTIRVMDKLLQSLFASPSGSTRTEKIVVSGKESIKSLREPESGTPFLKLFIPATDPQQTIVIAGFLKSEGKDYSQFFEKMLQSIEVF